MDRHAEHISHIIQAGSVVCTIIRTASDVQMDICLKCQIQSIRKWLAKVNSGHM